MSSIAINKDINGKCGGDFSRRVAAPWATKVAPTKPEQEALV
jgi:hypothetical protein